MCANRVACEFACRRGDSAAGCGEFANLAAFGGGEGAEGAAQERQQAGKQGFGERQDPLVEQTPQAGVTKQGLAAAAWSACAVSLLSS